VGVSQTLRRSTRNGITELSQSVPPMFGRAAITLGIDPRSSMFSIELLVSAVDGDVGAVVIVVGRRVCGICLS